MSSAPQTTDQGDDAIIAALSGIVIDLVLDGRLGPGTGSRTAAEALVAELDRQGSLVARAVCAHDRRIRDGSASCAICAHPTACLSS